MKSGIAVISLAIAAASTASSKHDAHPSRRPIQIKNESGRKTEIYWLEPSSGELVPQSGAVQNGQTIALNSYVNHTFVVKELPGKSGTCDEGTTYASPSLAPCKTAFIRVNEADDQVFHLLQDMEVELEDSRSKAQEATESIIKSKCEAKVKKEIEANNDMDPTQAVDAFISCAQPLLAQLIEQSNKEVKEEASLRTDLARHFEEYTCKDFDLPTTSPKSTKTWTYQGKDHTVGVLLDRDSAKVHQIKNFISSEECAAIEAAAAPSLHKATVADGAGGSKLEKSRKALQAGVRVPWERERSGDLIAAVARRLYSYVNEATGYGIQTAGQEDIMSIQYFGRGLDDPEPDRYMPHCDGQCDGLKFQQAGRVATMVMYCQAPEKGGATNFRNAGLHVVPEEGAAVFFSYLGSDGRTDAGLTEHSCCPVVEGSKKIAVQWLRLGVDDESPWTAFNTLNVRIGSEEL